MLKGLLTPKKKINGQEGATDAAAVQAAQQPANGKGKGKQPAPMMPKADTVGLVPVLAIVPPYLVTKDGTFIMMFEIPPLESSVAEKGSERAFWASRYGHALSTLPPGMKMQISVLLEPCNPEDDLAYFVSRSEQWHLMVGATDVSESDQRTAAALASAGDYITAAIAQWYDSTRPVNMRTIMAISWQPPFQIAKSMLFGSNTKNATISLNQIKSYLPQAEIALGEKSSLILQAFNGAGLPLKVLNYAEMCQVVWRTLHPPASGARNQSAARVAEALASGDRETIFGSPPPLSVFRPELTLEELTELLAPDTFVEKEDHFEVDGVLVSGYVIHDFRPNQPTYITRLADLPGGWCGTMFLEVADPAVVADRLRQREVQLDATEGAKASKGLMNSFSAGQEANAVRTARFQLETAAVTPIYIRFFVMRTANDKETLDKRTRDLESMLKTIGVAHFCARYNQATLFQDFLPVDRMHMNQKPRNMTPDSLSTFFWPERKRVIDPNGFYVGIDLETHLPVRLDVFGEHNEKNPSYLALGRPGAGKSVLLRTIMTSVLFSGGRVMAIDLEGEMVKYCEKYGGRYINIGTGSGEKINILDIPPDAEDALTAGVEHLVSFVSAVRGSPIEHGPEWNALSNAYSEAIKDRGWMGDGYTVTAWKHEDAPRLSDIVRILERGTTDGGVGRSLAEMLRPYSEGLYAPHFNVATSFDIRDERLVVFGLKSVNEDTSEIRLRVYLWQIMGLIWGEVLRRHSENPEVPNFVMLDEVWKLLSAPGGAKSIENMARRFRKRKAALWMATQEVGEFTDTPDGRKILAVVGNKFLMDQTPTGARRLQETLELSPGLASYLIGVGTGNGILITPGATLHIYVAVPQEWNVFTNV